MWGLHIKHPARWCFGLFLLWFIVSAWEVDEVSLDPSDDSNTCCPDHYHGRIASSDPCKQKVCLDCGHRACPSCDDWCDQLVPDPEDPGDVIECCDGSCRYVLGPAEGLIPTAC